MIKAITITNYLGSLDEHVNRALNYTKYETNNSTIHVELGQAEPTHGFLVEKIEGLGPVKADINMTDLATTDGSLYNSSRLQTRNIVLTFNFKNCPDAEAARLKTYRYLPIKRKVMLSVETADRNARVVGYVESNEPDIFSKEVKSVISIICPDPYFYSNEYGYSPHVITFTGINSEFEFPFSNDSLSEDLIEFGSMQRIVDKSFLYEGDQETGVNMAIMVNSTINTNITLIHLKNSYNPNDPEIQSEFFIDIEKFYDLMDETYLITGDVIEIDTTNGQKRITLRRSGVEYNILNAVSRDSDWFQLAKGSNTFKFTAGGNESKMVFRVENYVIYEGV